ncbi:hypothetical protein [Thermofilum sp.]|uniref:hypothetical protein n=1 Tax=Thermofilum sp. TaxID=1961369 RepID=UPI00319DC833
MEEHDSIKIIPDSSFFVFFLDDIKMTDILRRIITFDRFTFVLCEKVKIELQRNLNFRKFFNDLNERFEYFEYSMFAEILRPLFAEEEIVKGEHEIIVAAYVYHHALNQSYIVIIDEEETRKFIQRNFPEISKNVMGTLGFIKKIYSDYGILSKDEVSSILHATENSKFRISKDILEKIKKEILGNTR